MLVKLVEEEDPATEWKKYRLILDQIQEKHASLSDAMPQPWICQ